ncbi:MAG: hypothetical protein WBA88_16665, partial [Pseudaminobacter sp.]
VRVRGYFGRKLSRPKPALEAAGVDGSGDRRDPFSREAREVIAMRLLILLLVVFLAACQSAQRTEAPPPASSPSSTNGSGMGGASGPGGAGY